MVGLAGSGLKNSHRVKVFILCVLGIHGAYSSLHALCIQVTQTRLVSLSKAFSIFRFSLPRNVPARKASGCMRNSLFHILALKYSVAV